MGIEVVFLILAVLVVAFGIGVIVVNRRRTAAGTARPQPPVAPSTPPPRAPGAGTGTAVEERPIEAEPVEAPVVEPEVVPVPRSFRERLSKARSAFTGAFAGVLGRGAIDNDSFDDLEEALLRADVGVRVTMELIDGLRSKVDSKEITEPQAAAR